MNRRQLLLVGLATTALAGVGCSGTSNPQSGSSPHGSQNPADDAVRPTTESLQQATAKALDAAGAKEVGIIVASAEKGIVVHTAGKISSTKDGTSTPAENDAKLFANTTPVGLDKVKFDLLAKAVGDGANWSGYMMMLKSGHVVTSGTAATFIDDKPVEAFDTLVSKDALGPIFDEAMLLTAGTLIAFTGEDTKAQVLCNPSPDTGDLGYTRLAAPGPLGLIDCFNFAENSMFSLAAPPPKDLTGDELVQRLDTALAARGRKWEDMHAFFATDLRPSDRGGADRERKAEPALLLSTSNRSPDGVPAFMNAEAQKTDETDKGAGEPSLVGKQGPSKLPGGWSLDDNYTVLPDGPAMKDTNGTWMYSYRKGKSVISISYQVPRMGRPASAAKAEFTKAHEVDGWTVGTWENVPAAIRVYAGGSYLMANVRPANPATEAQLIEVVKAFHKAVTS